MGHRPKSDLQKIVEESAAKLFATIFRFFPHRTTQRLGSILAVIIHDMLHIRVDVALDNLQHAYPNSTLRWRKRTVRQVYAHFGAVAVELARIPVLVRGSYDKWAVVHGNTLAEMDKAVASGKGGLVVSSHLGNWEVMGAWAAWKGYPITYVVAQQSNQLIEELIDYHRESAGIEIIKRTDAAKGIIDALNRNRIIAIMVDQDARKDGVFVPFFGRQASTFRGVGTFAIKRRPHVMSMETWREKDGRIHCQIEGVDVPNTGDRDQDIYTLIANLTELQEKYVRRHPEQWLWLHRRWKTRPENVE
jgi:Kdo2-lipid IVA lauroyltransferase/acyltransferase